MKRDVGFMCELLRTIQKTDYGAIPNISRKFDDPVKFAVHRDMLVDSGYLELIGTSIKLTGRGHDFLMYTENEDIWQKIQPDIQNNGVNMEDIEQLAKKFHKENLGLQY